MLGSEHAELSSLGEGLENTCLKGINSKSKPAPKDGTDAVHAISLAIVIMAQIYKDNKIPLQLVQVKEPQFIADPDKPPETSFQKSDSPLSDADSMHVIFQAIVVMAKFYEGNKNPFQQVQVKELEFRVDPDKAPETSFQKSDRSGKSGTDAVHVISRAIVAMAEFYKENKIPLQLA